MTYSASGVMKWGAYPHPFTEIMRKSFEEIRHQVDPKELQLIGFGVDARKLYFQFSFVERTAEQFPDLVSRFPENVSAYHIPFELEQLVAHVVNHCWEPAAEAALLSLCVDEFGLESVRTALLDYKLHWDKRRMKDEWDYRASRPRLLPDMSVRYPADQLERASKRYVDAVLRFIGDEIRDKDVLEVGCGTGRITERLQRKARSVTCVDLCERMIFRNRQRLGSKAASIEYVNKFAQEYVSQRHFEVAVCSLVLVHNVYDSPFHDLVGMMCRQASVVYVFEDVTENRGTSPHTELRSETVIKEAFAGCDYDEAPDKEKHFQLFDDRIVFLRFQQKVQQSRS
jgi:SAM-dependent methyltransferase